MVASLIPFLDANIHLVLCDFGKAESFVWRPIPR
jgi:hypothetical protein